MLQSRAIISPAIEDYQYAALMFGAAFELDPDNASLLRLQIEAWRAAKEEDKALDAAQHLLRLDPDDTVALLRALSARINQLQRIEDRLALYKTYLGPSGDRLDPSVRSRLAFDAALLHREIGDDPAFLDHLRRSIELDRTNKQAVVLASTLFFERVNDPIARFDMHTQLLLADPLDSETHLAIARELQANGAHTGARRYMQNGITIRTKRGESQNDTLLNLYFAVTWGVEGAERFLDRLAEEEAAARYAVDLQRRAAERAEGDPSEIPDHSVSPIEDRTRLLMATALGREEQALSSYDRYRTTLARSLDTMVEQGRVSGDQLSRLRRRLAVERIRLQAWTGVDLGGAERELDTILSDENSAVRQESIDRYLGLFAAHRAEREEAERLLSPLADDGDALARLGLGLAAEQAGDRRLAAAHYAVAMRDSPGAVEGLWARTRLGSMLGAPVKPSEVALRLNALAQEAPKQLERLINTPSEHITLNVSLPERALDAMTPLVARVEMRNAGTFALGIGPGAPIAPRLLVAPKLAIGGAPVTDLVGPEFSSLARKLRLLPGESVTTDVWIGAGGLGTVVESTHPLAASLRCQAIHAYSFSDDRGVYRSDAYGFASSSGVVWRRPDRPSPPFEEILERVTSLSGEEFYLALYEAQWFFAKNPPADDDGSFAEQKREIAETIAARYPTMSPIERAFAMLSAPAGVRMEETIAIDEAARDADPHPLTTLVLLLTRVTGQDDPVLARALASEDPTVREIAEISKLRLDVSAGMRRLSEQSATPGEPAPTR